MRGIIYYNYTIYTVQLFSIISLQEKSISKEQLSTILNAEALLNDHFSMINNLIAKCNKSSTK